MPERNATKVQQRITLGTVMIVSLAVVIFLHWQFEREAIAEGFAAASEAVFIAAFLALTVDPFLKRELFREASSDIFLFWLGYSLPHQINDFLHGFVTDTKLFRRDCVLHWKVVDDPASGRVSVELGISYESENVTRKWQRYQQQARVYDNSPEEQNKVLLMECVAPMYPDLEYRWGPNEFQQMPDGYKAGPELWMPPQRVLESKARAATQRQAGYDRITFKTAYSSRHARTASDSWTAGAPTMNVTVICEPTDRFKFGLNWQSAREIAPGKWRMDDIFLIGHGFHVSWEPR